MVSEVPTTYIERAYSTSIPQGFSTDCFPAGITNETRSQALPRYFSSNL